ncbi:nucleotidyltransferase domain-containing protein [Nocardioides sp. InS609-2]|uniref:nucleotidyltransferase domain-containing protein n=1 Tax=Nocardioides sp. InS609-2 TaxID=2760705 RepID=UPI0020C04AE0|nr:nucleotidyltransferase domain-containing protein [Nocardioides sp. InS609-2]
MTRDDCLRALTEILERDPRVRGAWLVGSLGRGAGDELSDLDVLVVVDLGDRETWLVDWDEAIAARIPVVLQQRIELGEMVVLNHVTEDWVRFDVSVVPPGDLVERAASSVKVLFDRDDLQSSMTGQARPIPPSGHRVGALAREFLRVLGLLPVVLGRDELEIGASGSGLLRGLLIQLMLEDACVPDRGGALKLRGVLRNEHLELLRRLPPIEATRESILAVHLAGAEGFLPLARELSERTGEPWPQDLETALRRHLERELDLRLGS